MTEEEEEEEEEGPGRWWRPHLPPSAKDEAEPRGWWWGGEGVGGDWPIPYPKVLIKKQCARFLFYKVTKKSLHKRL